MYCGPLLIINDKQGSEFITLSGFDKRRTTGAMVSESWWNWLIRLLPVEHSSWKRAPGVTQTMAILSFIFTFILQMNIHMWCFQRQCNEIIGREGVMSSWGSDLWDRGEVGCSFVSRWSSRWCSQSDLWNRGRSVALLLLNGLKDGDSQLCNTANVQVVITRTLAEAEELGTALPRWFYLSQFNRLD